ncbi:hypothetical protein JCM8547_005863 [Rhodosporidiobolus lusitaniae]
MFSNFSRSSVASSLLLPKDAPPGYTSTKALPILPSAPAVPAPSPVFPSTYPIHPSLPPTLLLTPSSLSSHLLLLSSFHALRLAVSALPSHSGLGAGKELGGDEKWGLFVTTAVWRFEKFLEMLRGKGEGHVKEELGGVMPLDCALVLHTYLLNPRRFDEDKVRNANLSQLSLFSDVLLTQVAECISPLNFAYHPSPAHAEAWKILTSLPFDPVAAFSTSEGRMVVCPRTRAREFVPWLTPSGTGYAQAGFKFTTQGGEVITHEVLGIAKLAGDVYSAKCGAGYIAGTVHSSLESPSTPSNSYRAKFVVSAIQDRSNPLARATSREEVGRAMGWSRRGARRVLGEVVGEGRRGCVSLIIACYTRVEPFSLDLSAAVLRQTTFITKLSQLGWLSPSRFPSPSSSVLLQRSVARYHAFLSLLQSRPEVFAVPTIDIDLAWHTHQLMARYKTDVKVYVGRFVDHDDKVEENALADSFERTAKAWQSRYGTPYSHCGCPVPSPPPSIARLSPSPSTSLSPEAEHDEQEATHPSDHNSLVLLNSAVMEEKRKEREKGLEAWRRRERAKRRKSTGSMDMGAGKLEREEGEEEGRGKGGGGVRPAAFFMAIPAVLLVGSIDPLVNASGCVPTEPNHSQGLNSGTCGTAGGACVSALSDPSGGGAGGGTCASCSAGNCASGGCGGGCGGS